MVTDYIKIPSLSGQDPSREVGPVAPYPRINPQQQRHEGYSRQQKEGRKEDDNQIRRRFTAMRRLIEQLKEQGTIFRVDHATAEQELRSAGLAITEEELIGQLLQLKIPLNQIEGLLQQVRENTALVNLTVGRKLIADDVFLPVTVDGLAEYTLRFEDLQIGLGQNNRHISEAINNDGRFVSEQNRLRLTFRRQNAVSEAAEEHLRLTVSALVGVIEVDEQGRRALLYERPNHSYALYSDKPIDLSI